MQSNEDYLVAMDAALKALFPNQGALAALYEALQHTADSADLDSAIQNAIYSRFGQFETALTDLEGDVKKALKTIERNKA